MPPPPATPPFPRGSQPLWGGLCARLPLPAVPRTARRLYTRRLPTRLHRTHDNPTVTNHKDSFAMGRAPGGDAQGHHAPGQGEASGGSGAGAGQGVTFTAGAASPPPRWPAHACNTEGVLGGVPVPQHPICKCPTVGEPCQACCWVCAWRADTWKSQDPFPFSHAWGAEPPLLPQQPLLPSLPLLASRPSHPMGRAGVPGIK